MSVAAGLRVTFSKKNRYGLGECVYQILAPYRISFGQYRHYIQANMGIHYGLHGSRGFKKHNF